MNRLFQAIRTQNQSQLNEMLVQQEPVNITDTMTLSNLLEIKAELKPEYGGTITYHSLVIPKFQIWVQRIYRRTWKSIAGGGLYNLDHHLPLPLNGPIYHPNRWILIGFRSIQFGRPIPRYKGRHYVDEEIFLSDISSPSESNLPQFLRWR